MAVAGLHNLSVFDSSFLGESRSPVLRRWAEQDRPSTRASFLLQMWRELEGEHVVSHPNGRFGERPRRFGSETSYSDRVSTQGSVNEDDNIENSIMVENGSSSFCDSLIESENEHEDTNSFSSEQSSSDVGEIERERVRHIFREWTNNTSGVKSNSPNTSQRNKNNRSRTQWLGENECGRVRIIREWVHINSQQRDEGVAEVGSQIDLVRNGQMVNNCVVGERRPIPLRKLCGRQALVDLLEKAQMQRKKELQDLSECKHVSSFPHRNRIQSLLRGRFLLNRRLIQDERPSSTAASELGSLRQRNTVSDLREGFLSRLDSGSVNDVQFDASSNDDLNNHTNEQSQSTIEQDMQEVICDQSIVSRNEQIEMNETHSRNSTWCMVVGNQQEYDASVTAAQDQVLGNEEQVQETSRVEIINGTHDRENDASLGSGNQQFQQISHPLESFEIYIENDAQPTRHVHEAQLEESLTEHEESELWQLDNDEISEWAEVYDEGTGEIWQEGTANQWYQEASGNDVREHNHIQESDEEWHGNVLQEAIDSWLDVPSEQEAISFARADSFRYSDEDNNQSTELRELVSRRRVSTLLGSGFRESLDQLIQSYVQRQNHASVDWEMDEDSSPPASVDQYQEPQLDNQDEGQPSWDQELQNVNWPGHNPLQHVGNEWEIFKELKFDMVRLQQRMNNMQRMLEACMDMQLELQHSLRQEVAAAALNRSVNSTDACMVNLQMDDTKWDHVRKGICCMCRENNIDSLLYRCGHMCTCSNCADKLVQGGKCPMCWAPVNEVVRAYFIQ